MNKIRRPTAKDYIGVAFSLKSIPTQEEFIYDVRKNWDNYFTEAEKTGTVDASAPLNFQHYLRLSKETLEKQRDEVIPGLVRKGTLSREDAAASTELITILIGYEEQELSRLQM